MIIKQWLRDGWRWISWWKRRWWMTRSENLFGKVTETRFAKPKLFQDISLPNATPIKTHTIIIVHNMKRIWPIFTFIESHSWTRVPPFWGLPWIIIVRRKILWLGDMCAIIWKAMLISAPHCSERFREWRAADVFSLPQVILCQWMTAQSPKTRFFDWQCSTTPTQH